MCYAASKLWNVCNYERRRYKELGLEFKAGLLPEDKVKAVTELNQHAYLLSAHLPQNH